MSKYLKNHVYELAYGGNIRKAPNINHIQLQAQNTIRCAKKAFQGNLTQSSSNQWRNTTLGYMKQVVDEAARLSIPTIEQLSEICDTATASYMSRTGNYSEWYMCRTKLHNLLASLRSIDNSLRTKSRGSKVVARRTVVKGCKSIW